MNILLIGSGGREHSIAKSLSKSKKLKNLYCIPGNAGIEEVATCYNKDTSNKKEILEYRALKLKQPKLPIEKILCGKSRPRYFPGVGKIIIKLLKLTKIMLMKKMLASKKSNY